MTTNYKTSFLLPHDYEIPTFNYPKYVLPLYPEELPTINNWNFVDSSLNNIQKEFKNYNNKWYFIIWKRGTVEGWEWQTSFFKYNESAPRMTGAWLNKIKSIYCWNGVGDPKRPKINNDGIIIDWNIGN